MCRRDFMRAGPGLALDALAPRGVRAQAVAEEVLSVGDLVIHRDSLELAVTHVAEPERALWETDPEGRFLRAARGVADNRARGIPERSFDIVDRVEASWATPTIIGIARNPSRLRSCSRRNGDVSGAVVCTFQAENLIEPVTLLFPVSRKIETLDLTAAAEKLVAECQ